MYTSRTGKKLLTLCLYPLGIGAGSDCDGQVLVLHDMLGMFDDYIPSFVKQFAQVGKDYGGELRPIYQKLKNGSFPVLKNNKFN